MKLIPNYISVSRMIFSIILLFIKPLSNIFYVIYIICGFSDIMDGFISRATGTTSILGAKLDSLADMIMAGVLLIVLLPTIKPEEDILIWVISIGIIKLLTMVVAFKKFKTFAALHTYGNKFTGIILFLFPMLLPYFHSAALMYIICAVASISAIEELIIQITSTQLQLNKKSIFEKSA